MAKWVEQKKLTVLEEQMRWYLQDAYDKMEKYNHDDLRIAWNENMLFANFLLPNSYHWGVVRGKVTLLFEEAE